MNKVNNNSSGREGVLTCHRLVQYCVEAKRVKYWKILADAEHVSGKYVRGLAPLEVVPHLYLGHFQLSQVYPMQLH